MTRMALSLLVPPRGRRAILVGALALFVSGPEAAPAGSPPEAAKPDPVVFDDVADAAGVKVVVDQGRSPERRQPEPMIAGVVLLDYDGDGRLDIYVVNGATMPGLEKQMPHFSNRLYRNNGDGTYTDVTVAAGVEGRGYEMGAVAGDYDNDGDADLFVTGLRHNILYRNEGNGTFTDVTTAAGLDRPDPEYGTLWAVAAAFADVDRDGWLDLFVSNYCVWDPKTEPECGEPEGREYCHPDKYAGLPNSLFRNNGDGTFTDISVSSGIRAQVGKGMGIGVADFDDDGWVDFFVSNDTLPAFLFMNRRDGTFEETSLESGVAFTESGRPISGMGADARDVDNDGRPDIFQTALMWEDFPLFRNLGGGRFEEVTRRTGVSALARARAGWSNGIYDFNNDGLKDLFVACASVMDPDGRFKGRVLMPNAVFLQGRDGRFVDGSPGAGPDFQRPAVHRGAAFGDLDDDGRVDAVVTALEGPVEIWRNVSPARHHWLLVRTVGSRSNRDGQGAKLKLVSASGVQYNHVNTAVGYGGSSDPRAHFGLGADSRVEELTLTWPSGTVQTLKDVAVDQVLTVREP
jgi:hypothetical protein